MWSVTEDDALDPVDSSSSESVSDDRRPPQCYDHELNAILSNFDKEMEQIDRMNDGSNEDESISVVDNSPAPRISNRRKSLRLMDKDKARNQGAIASDTTAPSSSESKSVGSKRVSTSKSVRSDSGDAKRIRNDERSLASTEAIDVDKDDDDVSISNSEPKSNSIKRKRKSHPKRITVTALILKNFNLQSNTETERVEGEPGEPGEENASIKIKEKKLTAICKLCNEQKQYTKKSYWNLQSHFEKVRSFRIRTVVPVIYTVQCTP